MFERLILKTDDNLYVSLEDYEANTYFVKSLMAFVKYIVENNLISLEDDNIIEDLVYSDNIYWEKIDNNYNEENFKNFKKFIDYLFIQNEIQINYKKEIS